MDPPLYKYRTKICNSSYKWPKGDRCNEDVPVVTWKAAVPANIEGRMCSETTHVLGWARRKGELKYVHKLTAKSGSVNKKMTGRVVDIAPLNDGDKTMEDVLALAGDTLYIMQCTSEEHVTLAHGACSFSMIRSEWLDKETIIVLGKEGALVAIDVPAFIAEYASLNADEQTPPIAISDKPELFKTVAQKAGTATLSTTVFQDGTKVIATTLERSPTSIALFTTKDGKVYDQNTVDLRGRVISAHWLGSSQHRTYSDILAVLSHEGSKLTFLKGGTERIGTIDMEHVDGAEATGPWLFDAQDNTVIISRIGLKAVLVFTFVHSEDNFELMAGEYSIEQADSWNEKKDEGELYSITIPAFEARRKTPEFCWLSTTKFSRSSCPPTLDRLTPTGKGSSPQPPQQSKPVPPTAAPAAPEKEEPKPKPAQQYQDREPTTTPLPKVNFAPFSKISARNDVGGSLAPLQNLLQELRNGFETSTEVISDRIQKLELVVHDQRQAALDAHDERIALAKNLSSDLSKGANEAYFSPVQREIRSLSRKMGEDISELGTFLNAPAVKMLEELDISNKENVKAMEAQFEKFGEDLANFLRGTISKYISEIDVSAASVSDLLSKELSSQFTIMTEKRLQEICTFQVKMELDFESVCNDIREHLQQCFVAARDNAVEQAARQLATVARQRDDKLVTYSQRLQEKFAELRAEFNQIQQNHDNYKLEMESIVANETMNLSSSPKPMALAQLSSQPPAVPAAPAVPPPPSVMDFIASEKYEEAIDHCNEVNGNAKDFRALTMDKAVVVLGAVRPAYTLNIFRDVLMHHSTESYEDTATWVKSIFRALRDQDFDKNLFIQLGEWGISQFSAEGKPIEYKTLSKLIENQINRCHR